MSIYFQYPSIVDYPNLIWEDKKHEIKLVNINDENSVKMEEIKELKDFLNLKPV